MREGERRRMEKDDIYEHIRGTVHIYIHIYRYIHILTLSSALMSAPCLIKNSIS